MRIKKYLFVVLLLALFIPALQQRYPFITSAGLKGWFTYEPMPDFSWTTWFSGDLQAKMDKGLESNIGLHPAFVRLNNQLNYSLFGFSAAKSVLVGKEGYLFEEGYINGYLGINGADSNKVRLKILKAEYVSRELRKRGKHLLILLAPGKASFYPEYLPERYDLVPKQLSYHDLYSAQLKRSTLDYIDFNSYFVEQKNRSPYPLYPKQGTHWSIYGATLAMDSLLKYIKTEYRIDLPQVRIAGIDTPYEWRVSDYDIGTGMNLMFPMKHQRMAYPRIEFESDSGKTRPSVLAVGDSYYWTWVGFHLSVQAFRDHEFWYYNKEIYPDYKPVRTVTGSDVNRVLREKDIILILQTEAYYYDLGMGFIESAYEELKKQEHHGI